MKSRVIFSILLALILMTISCKEKDTTWLTLFNNRDFTGWEKYLGPRFDTLENRLDTLLVEGLNSDSNQVFTVVNEDGQPAIRISGETHGGVSTVQEYKNYHLKLEFKWGKLKWAPRKDKKRDSGLLYHGVGKQGAAYGNWLLSQECQIQEGDVGDYWSVAGSIVDVKSSKMNDTIYYDPKGSVRTFSYTSKEGKRCYKSVNAERPSGEWNTIDIYCLGDSAVHVVNGIPTMVILKSRRPEGDKETPLTKGKIQLQSEGAEVFYRNLQLQSIDKIPAALLN